MTRGRRRTYDERRSYPRALAGRSLPGHESPLPGGRKVAGRQERQSKAPDDVPLLEVLAEVLAGDPAAGRFGA